ncbi:ribonuclease H-like domain-containing protein [Cyanobacterium aponinum UTEX 3222]|uniref:Ribonuclease D n=1 Tax=Cyanobacterium aponinum 0216 TaxID=2676140 RepID=A0A844GRM0_9CHRO|nr:ribonuclease H-like domain-containing protein [Cyanobacterium aponinum]MBD2393520.1 ribonuclease D [Cyanobacterium aponinum FACHB-4101]MTF37721.1 ribonuclease D [Cyanobacterium aponinum 0216]WRL38766.1 ribonuclease H-like domain-containing protein [Cyanobacterium aponinum UTEX 3221]WRL40944.1 ribonuclease H-like domain-containing protein [Cyanobacterium aponinum UTEX 3222]
MSLNQFQVCEGDLSPEIFRQYSESDCLAMDTETMGLIPQRDRLCLVQVCDRNGLVTAIRIAKGQTEAPLLQKLLENPDITKIFHYARFDVAQFKHTFGVETNSVFCTKIASKIARTYTQSHGLKSLVQELEGVELDKKAQSSDWGNVNSLTSEQLSYAANDVRYLIPVKDKLITMLQREDRWSLTRRCFEAISLFVDLDLMYYNNVFEHQS